ncbi:neogenin-like isoform X2 [Crassostrea virginica]
MKWTRNTNMMIYQATSCMISYMVIGQVSMEGQYNLTGSLQAAILGMDFSWTCSTTISPGQTHDVVIFRRNDIDVGLIVRFPNKTCKAFSMHPRYDYRCDTDHTFSLIIPANSMTEYENNSMWRCEYAGGGYRSSTQMLNIAVFIRNISLSPHDDPMTLIEGTTNKITCFVNSDANPTPVIQWYIGETEIGGTEETLELTADKIHDGRKLLCLATNNNKSLNNKPKVAVEPSHLLDVGLGEQLTVRCRVLKSNPEVILGYEWSVLGENDVIGRETNFTIERISVNDNKTLQCRARNSVGTSEPASVRINILLLPARPDFIKVICCNGYAVIVWVTMISGFDQQESFIQVTSSAVDRDFSNASTVVNSTLNGIYSVRVTDLFPETMYTFRVVTVNQYGHTTSNAVSCQMKELKLKEASIATSIVAVSVVLGGLVILAIAVASFMYMRVRRLSTKEDDSTKSSGSTEEKSYEMQLSPIAEEHPYQEMASL